jgi:hypothetical protein
MRGRRSNRRPTRPSIQMQTHPMQPHPQDVYQGVSESTQHRCVPSKTFHLLYTLQVALCLAMEIRRSAVLSNRLFPLIQELVNPKVTPELATIFSLKCGHLPQAPLTCSLIRHRVIHCGDGPNVFPLNCVSFYDEKPTKWTCSM